MDFLFAPMEGITYSAYRRVHNRLFPGAAEYYTPFISPDSKGSFKPKYLRELTCDAADGINVIPQLMANSAEAFSITARKFRDIGFCEVNLNVGCPSGTVTAKKKGSGMLENISSLDLFLDRIYSDAESAGIKISIKTRMGVHSTSEFPSILEIYNKYPISKLIIHARDREGLYKSEPDLPGFAHAFSSCRCPVSYNGNIFSREDMERILSYVPSLSSVMVGRGIAANPALIDTLITPSFALTAEKMELFHDSLMETYLSEGLCEQFTLERMKQLWYYMIHMFSNCRKEQKAILKSQTLHDYRIAARNLFRSDLFNPEGKFYQI